MGRWRGAGRPRGARLWGAGAWPPRVGAGQARAARAPWGAGRVGPPTGWRAGRAPGGRGRGLPLREGAGLALLAHPTVETAWGRPSDGGGASRGPHPDAAPAPRLPEAGRAPVQPSPLLGQAGLGVSPPRGAVGEAPAGRPPPRSPRPRAGECGGRGQARGWPPPWCWGRAVPLAWRCPGAGWGQGS